METLMEVHLTHNPEGEDAIVEFGSGRRFRIYDACASKLQSRPLDRGIF
jgi:hypothetical protein